MQMVFFGITFNPNYQGRSKIEHGFTEIPFTVPDLEDIVAFMLINAGYATWETLAPKYVGFFSTCGRVLTKRTSYDFGLRAIKRGIKSYSEEDKVEEEAKIANGLMHSIVYGVSYRDRIPAQTILMVYFESASTIITEVENHGNLSTIRKFENILNNNIHTNFIIVTYQMKSMLDDIKNLAKN